MNSINNENIVDFLKVITDVYEDRKDELSKYDSIIGDGDHGYSIARGTKAAYEVVCKDLKKINIYEALKIYSRELTAEIGGAIGPLFGIIFSEIGKASYKETQVSTDILAEGMASALEKIKDLGGAEVGDKTMVDSISPAVESLIRSRDSYKNLISAIEEAVKAAEEGVISTIPMEAKKGRSKYLRAQSIGHQDAGATSFMYLLKGIRSFIEDCPLWKENDKLLCTNVELIVRKEEAKEKKISKKFINSPDTMVQEVVSSFVQIYSHIVAKLPNTNVLIRKEVPKGRVGIVIGNGSGHEPACIGFVGKNALTANAYGNLFAAPGPKILLEAIKAADTGAGTVVLISNHAGDVLNSKIAIEWAREDGYQVEGVILYDDVLSAPYNEPLERRGTAGTFFNYRMLGAYAEQGHNLQEVARMAERIRDNTRTVTVASLPGTSPINGERMFEISDDEYELGVGVHGEAAVHRIQVSGAEAIARKMCDILINDKPYSKDDEVLVLVNGCGQTTYGELLIFFGEVKKYLDIQGIKVYRPAIGSFITTQEMAGIALSFCKVDEDIKKCWDSDTDAPGFPKQ